MWGEMMEKVDLRGRQFGLWSVIGDAVLRGKNKFWHCKCECGTHKDVKADTLLSGRSTSCGCKRSYNLLGKRFGRLTVIRRVGYKRPHVVWECKCDCGTIVETVSVYLIRGDKQSCGCLWADRTGINNYNYKDGRSGMPEYKIYHGARHRCLDMKDPDYGGRGIKFLYSNFEEFVADIGPRPSSKYSLDRKK